MAVAVVQALEMVDIEEDDRHGQIEAGGAFGLAVEETLEGAPVEAAGEIVAQASLTVLIADARESGGERHGGDEEHDHEYSDEQAHLPQARHQRIAAQGHRGIGEVEGPLEQAHAEENQKTEGRPHGTKQDHDLTGGDLPVRRRADRLPREHLGLLSADPKERRHQDHHLKKVAEDPAQPQALALRERRLVSGVVQHDVDR